MKSSVNIFWFRRDLRLHDNTALFHALQSKLPVLPIFIFDENIIDELPEDDARISFIYDTLWAIDNQLKNYDRSLKVFKGIVFTVKIFKNFFNISFIQKFW